MFKQGINSDETEREYFFKKGVIVIRNECSTHEWGDCTPMSPRQHIFHMCTFGSEFLGISKLEDTGYDVSRLVDLGIFAVLRDMFNCGCS